MSSEKDKLIRIDVEANKLLRAAAALEQRTIVDVASELLRHGARKIIYKHTAAADGLEVEA